MSRFVIPLENVQIASHCHADWDAMKGDDQSRFCGSCAKNVYNLSEMTRSEAEALIAAKEGKLCVRYYQRADGTVITQDCPLGLARVRHAALIPMRWVAAGAAALAAWAVLLCGGEQRANATTVRKAKAVSPSAYLSTLRMGQAKILVVSKGHTGNRANSKQESSRAVAVAQVTAELRVLAEARRVTIDEARRAHARARAQKANKPRKVAKPSR